MKETITYDDGLSVKIQLLNIHSYPIHNHTDFQVLYVLEGELSLKLFYAKYRLQPGSIHIIHSEDVHSLRSITEKNLVLVISFNREYFQSIFPHFSSTIFITNIQEGAFEKRDILCDQIFAIVSEEYDKSAGYITRINNAAVAFINTLMNNFRGFVVDDTQKRFIHKTSHDYIQTDRVSRIIQYVYENYPYKISLANIAGKEQMSPYYLSHIFHKLVGINFRDFLSMVRVEMSEFSVLSTNKSITQIAQDMGFSDAKYYVSHFHKYMGFHPKEYRRKYAEKIYGVAPVDTIELPLSQLESTVDKYTNYPVFKEHYTKVNHIEMDFKLKVIGKFPNLKNVVSSIDDICLDLINDEKFINDAASQYQDINPQASAVELLQQLTVSPDDFQLPKIRMFDTQHSNAGLLTINGLKKPIYHLLNILKKLPGEITIVGSNHIGLHNRNEHYLLMFNPNESESIIFDVVTRNVLEKCKLTKYELLSKNSCINFWSQLNFNNHLKAEDIKNINYMTLPDIEFEMILPLEQHYSSIELAPCDIVLFKYSSLKFE